MSLSDQYFHFRYQWTAGNAGTHFWHAHTGLQKMDGLYGSIVVRQPPSKDPNSYLYDYDLTTHVIMMSDWMHEDAAERFPGRLAVSKITRKRFSMNAINHARTNKFRRNKYKNYLIKFFWSFSSKISKSPLKSFTKLHQIIFHKESSRAVLFIHA